MIILNNNYNKAKDTQREMGSIEEKMGSLLTHHKTQHVFLKVSSLLKFYFSLILIYLVSLDVFLISLIIST